MPNKKYNKKNDKYILYKMYKNYIKIYIFILSVWKKRKYFMKL